VWEQQRVKINQTNDMTLLMQWCWNGDEIIRLTHQVMMGKA
jgi:hypothetical protein